MVIPETVNRADPFESRTAIALALHKMAPQISQSLVEPLFQFFISGALGDRHSAVRKTMLDAAVSVVDLHGAEAVTNLMKMFEDYLSAAHANDYINEAVVIVSLPVVVGADCLALWSTCSSLGLGGSKNTQGRGSTGRRAQHAV